MGIESHGFATIEDSRGRWWRSARAHRWIRWGRWSLHLGGEWVHWASWGQRVSLGGKLSTSGEETLDVHYNLGRWIRHYWSLDVERDDRLLRLPSVRVEAEVGLTEASWCFGPNDHSWARDASWRERLRRNDLKWWRVGRYRRTCTTLDRAEVEIPLPEGGARMAHLELQEETWPLRVGPYAPTRRSRRRLSFYLPWTARQAWSVDIKIPDGLPVPENDDSDFYTGDGDAIFGCGCSVPRSAVASRRTWIGLAQTRAIDAMLHERLRHGRSILDTGAR